MLRSEEKMNKNKKSTEMAMSYKLRGIWSAVKSIYKTAIVVPLAVTLLKITHWSLCFVCAVVQPIEVISMHTAHTLYIGGITWWHRYPCKFQHFIRLRIIFVAIPHRWIFAKWENRKRKKKIKFKEILFLFEIWKATKANIAIVHIFTLNMYYVLCINNRTSLMRG